MVGDPCWRRFRVALVRESWPFIALGILVLIAFDALDALDARYLGAERRARAVYNAVADENSVVPLSLSGLATQARPGRWWWWPNRFMSWSILYFYGPLAIVGGALLIFALLAGPKGEEEPADPKPPAETHRS